MLEKNIKNFSLMAILLITLSSCATMPPKTTSYAVKKLNLTQYSNNADYHYIMAFVYLYDNKIDNGMKEYEVFLNTHTQNKFYIEFVNILIRLKKFNKAETILREMIRHYPKDSKSYLLLSDIYVLQNQDKKAIAILIQSGIKTFDVYKNIALLYANMGDINNAVNYLMQAKKFSNIGEVDFYISQIYFNFGFSDNAKRYALMSVKEKYPKAFIILADMYAKQNNYPEAVKYYEQFLGLPNKAKEQEVYVYTELASIAYSVDKDTKKAIYYYQKAYNIGKSELNLERLSYLLLQNQNYERVISLLENNPSLGNSSTLQYFLGVAYFGAKNCKRALIELSSVNFASDLYTDAVSKRALCYLELKEPNKAIELLKKTLSTIPNEELYKTYFYILNQTKDWDDLIDALIASKDIVKEKEKNYFYLANIYYEKKHNVEKAIHYLNEALRINPNDPEVLNYLGYLYIDNNIDVKAGIALVQKALKKQPQNPYYLDSLGWGYYKEKEFNRALLYLKKANKLLKKPENDISLHLAQIYMSMRNKSGSKKIILEVLKRDPENKTAKDLLKALR